MGERNQGTPATKTPIFSSLPTNFRVIQLSELSMQPPIRNRHALFCMTDLTSGPETAPDTGANTKLATRILHQTLPEDLLNF